MSAFLTDLEFKDSGGFPFTLLKELVYASGSLGRIVTVPLGFKTDLASIPRLLWNILPPVGKYDAAAVLHDFLYATGGVTREEADAVLYDAMKAMGVGLVTRWLIYRAVRLGGGLIWKRYREAQQDKQET